ncbi:MAG: DUF4340 domain-containing protein [Chloroflexi bacterium]|nr:DUF4340 domain-containing protein [Chloroflexota bacterium]
MSFRYTLILLLVAIVAIGGFFIAQRTVPASSSGPPVTPTPVLVNLNPDTVTEMDVKITANGNSREADFSKQNNAWKLTNPPDNGDLDQAKVDNLATELATLHGTRTVAPAGSDISKYGLNNPRVTVTLSAGSQKSTVLVGDSSVDGQNYYAMTQGGDIELVSGGLVTTMGALVTNPPHVTPTPSGAPVAPAGTPAAAPS